MDVLNGGDSATAVVEIAALARASTEPRVIVLPDMARTLVWRDGEETREYCIPAPPKRLSLASLEDVAALTVGAASPYVFHEGAELGAPDSELAIYGGAVRLVMDYGGNGRQFDRAEMPLVPSDIFMTLLGLRGCRSMQPAEAVRMLRFELPLTELHGPDRLIELIGSLKFRVTGESDIDAAHGFEAMAEKLRREVVNADAIPQTVDLVFPMYTNDNHIRDLSAVKVALEVFIDIEHNGVVLTPVADELRRASSDVQDAISKWLGNECAETTTILHGKPMSRLSFLDDGLENRTPMKF